MTAQTRTRRRNAAGIAAICLILAVAAPALWYRATYHTWPGMMPPMVHWCGRDYQPGGGTQTWAQITAASPAPVRPVGGYPPIGPQRPLFAATSALTRTIPGEPCAMVVFLRTGPGRYQPYTLEGGP